MFFALHQACRAAIAGKRRFCALPLLVFAPYPHVPAQPLQETG